MLGGRGALTTALLAVAAVTAEAAPAATVSVALDGGKRERAAVCGTAPRAVTVARRGADVAAVVRAAPAGRRVVVVIDRCVGGEWRRVRVMRYHAGPDERRFRMPTGRIGDVRVRGRIGSGPTASRLAAAERAYLRVVKPPKPPREIVDVPVAFRVRNVNRSPLTCPSDGAEYTIRGRLVGPASKLRADGGVSGTLYLHEFTFGQFFWRFPIREYDFVTPLARAGHVSVIVDRLGYDKSPGPRGTLICVGSHADMAHQLVRHLRAGNYTATGATPPRFRRLALAGHSVGAASGEMAAYSFGGIDAFLLLAWADQGFSNFTVTESLKAGSVCLQGGEESHPGGPSEYAYFGQTAADFRQPFINYEEHVFKRALALRNRDPCGDHASLPAATALNQERVGEIRVPVFMLTALQDAVFADPREAGEQQEALYTGAPEIAHAYVDRTDHYFTLGRTAPKIRATVSRWLRKHGF